MKIRLECVTGGICFRKEIESNVIPMEGEVMTFPIAKGGQQMELVVQEVKGDVVVLSASIPSNERLSYEWTSRDGWTRSPISGFNWPA